MTTPPFVKDIRRFATLGEFSNYALTTYPHGVSTGTWDPIGATVHNTYIPNKLQWRGMASMASMVKDYMAKGWTSGPNLYLAVGTVNSDNDGIFMMTPLNREPTHAGKCNDTMFGVEVVDDFEVNTPSAAQLDLLVGVLVVLSMVSSAKGTKFFINAHKDCMANRTCPGQHMYDLMGDVRTRFTRAVTGNTEALWAEWGTEYPLPEPQRVFGIPSKWMASLITGNPLGAAKSYPVYDNATRAVTQLFEKGLIVYRDVMGAKVIWYRDLGR